MTILIPAYEPSEALLKLTDELRADRILIVDDGSGSRYREIFEKAKQKGCIILAHEYNKGKGEALKTGFRWIIEHGEEEGIVCADSDGQHLADDIMQIAEIVRRYQFKIVTGCRHFTSHVPLRSRFGNSVTKAVFAFASGTKLRDTQTGLRGYSADMLDWLCGIPGKRFEYEMNVLLEAVGAGYTIYETDIDTIYDSSRYSSHFRTFSDSIKVYLPIVKFCASSILSAILDLILLILLQKFTSDLLFSVIGARIISSIVNYMINRHFVFSGKKSRKPGNSLLRYYMLASALMLVNYLIMHLLYELSGIPLIIAKILTESTIFLFSYWFQKKFVFAQKKYHV
jgi:putative flippase GtrA